MTQRREVREDGAAATPGYAYKGDVSPGARSLSSSTATPAKSVSSAIHSPLLPGLPAAGSPLAPATFAAPSALKPLAEPLPATHIPTESPPARFLADENDVSRTAVSPAGDADAPASRTDSARSAPSVATTAAGGEPQVCHASPTHEMSLEDVDDSE